MPKMNGLELLRELNKYKISARVMMASTDTKEGAKTTLDALELGALDFIHKPDNAADCRLESFRSRMLEILAVVADSKPPVIESREQIRQHINTNRKMVDIIKKEAVYVPGNKIVAIASSTGGPKALQSVIPNLPSDIDAPVLLVQHMPKGFTASLAERLNSLSAVTVKEAAEGMELEKGTVYVAMGGLHMNVAVNLKGKATIHYTDEPNREGVKPCANYMFESLSKSTYDNILCVVMTGMGADGTEGIKNLSLRKKIHVISQNQETCTVYGMPKSVEKAGLANQVVGLDQIAQEIILHVGVSNR
jgi:two-component system chemotaxis response regulator CheB